MDNEELKEQVQEEQEQQVEQVDNDTPREQDGEVPEFALDENGNLQWNTNEFDHLNEEDSQRNNQNRKKRKNSRSSQRKSQNIRSR